MTAARVVQSDAAPAHRRKRPRFGFTLGEALVAMVLLGLVATILTRTLMAGQRIHQVHMQDVALNESTRAALAILPAELRELSAAEGDLIVMDSSAITFRALRALHLLCAAPDTVSGTALLDAAAVYGFSSLDPGSDSLLVFAERNPRTRLDDVWVAAGLAGVASGVECPGGTPGIELTLSGVSVAQLSWIQPGAPLRPFRPARLRAYQDAGGDWWLGQQEFQASSGRWSTVQPVLGPLVAAGLALAYLDTAGGPAGSASEVASIDLRVTSRSPRPVRQPAGAVYLVRDGTTRVFLRNNPRY